MIIEVKNVSKSFKLPHEKVDSLREGLTSFFTNKKTFDVFDALKDVSFEVEKGDFLGIIGRNGSGKSTLLKVMAGIYEPDKGKVIVKEKISPFLELGVGFNPELTARENVFLNGIVLGLSHKQVEAKYDEIVAFSGLEKFMDSKLKNFSSGMQVRLAFSVAIQSPAPILLIDEVLAVGDADFQAKCFNVFRRLKKEGRTIIFVSHDLSSIQQFCDKVIWMEKGKINKIGYAQDVISTYLNDETADETNKTKKPEKKHTHIADVQFTNENNENVSVIKSGESLTIKIKIVNDNKRNNLNFGVAIFSKDGNYVYGTNTLIDPPDQYLSLKDNIVTIQYESLPLQKGRYYLDVAIFGDSDREVLDFSSRIYNFFVHSSHPAQGIVNLNSEWK